MATQGASQIGVEDLVDLGVDLIQERLAVADTGVVDDDIDRSGLVEGRADRLTVVHVEPYRLRTAAGRCDIFDKLVEQVAAPGGGHHACPVPCQHRYEVATQTAGCTRNQDRFARNVEGTHGRAWSSVTRQRAVTAQIFSKACAA